MFSERFEFFKVLTYCNTVIKYVDAMQKNVQKCSTQMTSDWLLCDFCLSFKAICISSRWNYQLSCVSRKRLLLIVNIQFDGKAQFPNNSRFLKHDFNLTDDQLKKVFILPHNLAFEPYVRAFQYKILNSILYTNSKLYKIGYTADDKCSFVNQNQKRYLISSSIVIIIIIIIFNTYIALFL